MTIKKIFHGWINKLKQFYEFSRLSHQASIYQIQEINILTGIVTLYYRGGHTTIKSSIKEIISDSKIISGLAPLHACYLGYYHGKLSNNKSYRQDLMHLKDGQDGFVLKQHIGRFKITAFDHLSSTLTYLDTKLNKIYKETITMVAQEQFVIENIDPSQACYIGILVGESVAKHGTDFLFEKMAKPTLKLVK